MEENSYVKKSLKKKIRKNYSIHPENIIFYDYFNNLKRKALAQGYNNLVISFKKIINSIFKYPLPIKNCFDAYKLKGVGKRFSYYFEKALVQSQNENKHKCSEDTYARNEDNFYLNNHIKKVIKNADDFLKEFDQLYIIKKKNDVSEDDNILKNLKEIENDHLSKENKNFKCKLKNKEIGNNPLQCNTNNTTLCLITESDKYNSTNFSNNYTSISDDKKDKNKIFTEYKEESKRKLSTPNELEKTLSNYKKSLFKNNKNIELNNLEKNVLTVIEKYSHLYNENAMSKEEIHIEFLKNYKKSVNINFRSLNRLIKLNLLEKIECIESKSFNCSNISKNKMKLKIINKIKLTEKGKNFVDQEKEESLRETLIVKKEDKESSVQINKSEKGSVHTNAVDIEDNFEYGEYVTNKINESKENLNEEIIYRATQYNLNQDENNNIKEKSMDCISLVEYDTDKYKINSLKEKENSYNSDAEKNLNNDILRKEDKNISFIYSDCSIFIGANDGMEKNHQKYKDNKFSDEESRLIMLNNNSNEKYASDFDKLHIKEKEDEKKITESNNHTQHYEKIGTFKNSDPINKKSSESLKKFNSTEKKKESNYFEIKMEKKKKEIKDKLKLSLKEKLYQINVNRSIPNNISAVLKGNESKGKYFMDESEKEIKENEKDAELSLNSLCYDEKNEYNDILVKEYETDDSKIKRSSVNEKTNNFISPISLCNSEHVCNEKVILRKELEDPEESDSEVIISTNDIADKLNYKNTQVVNYRNNKNVDCEKENISNNYSDTNIGKKKLVNYDGETELSSKLNEENIDNQDKIIAENRGIFEKKDNNYNIIDISEESYDKHSPYISNYLNNNKKENKKNSIMFNEKREMEHSYLQDKKKKENKKKKKKRKNESESENEINIEDEKNQITYSPYEIIMVIDNRDISGANCEYNEKMVKIFKENNVKYITRNLPLGDTIWLCRRAVYNRNSLEKRKTRKKRKKEQKGINEIYDESILNKNNDLENNNEENIEYEEHVLKWIIERKTLNDLSASIIDGRYEEQKYRLMRSKEMYHVIYLIENCNNTYKNYMNSSKISYETLNNAKYSTQLVSGFSILNSQSMKHTLFLLCEIHFQIIKNIKRLCEVKENEELLHSDKLSLYLKNNSCLWDNWNNESKKSKNNIVKEVFGKQLRLINMCGSDATELILSLWPTPFKLNQALNKYTHNGILAEKIKRIYIKNYQIKGKKKIKSPIDTQLIAQLRLLYAPDSI